MIIPPQLRAIASPHRAIIEAQFGPLHPDRAYRPPADQMLFLCFTNRCGSNYLAQVLASTGAFNEAGEFFNAATVLEHAAARGLRSLPEYMAALPAIVPSHTNFAAKAAPDQLVMLADAGILDALAPRATYALLERQDTLGQAISRVIASQNLHWSSAHPKLIPDSQLQYDRAAIDAERAKIAHANAAFYLFFAANGIAPVHFTYEALRQNPQAALNEVGARMGLKLNADPGRVSLRPQAGAVTREWRKKYEREAVLF
jgi:LPS sulfotransferase NodH